MERFSMFFFTLGKETLLYSRMENGIEKYKRSYHVERNRKKDNTHESSISPSYIVKAIYLT